MNSRGSLRILWIVLGFNSCLGLAGCVQAPSKDATDTSTSTPVTQTPPAQEPIEISSTPEPEPSTPIDPNADTVTRLLEAAEQAVADNRLTTPLHDNAYDRYQAALLLSPGNAQALSGLDQIMMRYVELARDALRGSQFALAQDLADRAEEVSANNQIVAEVRDEIRKARRAYQAQMDKPPAEPIVNGKEIIFDARALARKDDRVVDQLQDLAQQIRDSDETMLIVARSDAEGRWIYQRMREAVPGYRLRGDIRVGGTPKIQLLPPIE